MRVGQRSPILGLVLVSVIGVLGLWGGPSMVLAQSAAASPTSTTAAHLFGVPTAAALTTAGSLSVIDAPAALPDTIDLAPVITAAAEAVAALPAADWEVEALAKTVTDPTAAFDLVRDSIRSDPYPGVLRGAEGTLAARAGNAFDRALLLKALLDAQGVTSRFAFGRVGAEHTVALVGRAFDGPAVALPSAGFSPFDDAFEQAVSNRAHRDHALLSEALGDRLAGLAADATAAAITDAGSHAWVQLQQADGSWLDLDPSMADAQPGIALTTAETTADIMPDEAYQTLTLRVIAETLADGSLSEVTVLEAVLPASVAAGQQVLITFQPASGGGGMLGGSLFGGSAGTGAYAPILMIDGDAWHGDPIVISGTDGGGGLMGGGGQVDLASLSLEIQTDAPGATPQVVRHLIADRIPPAVRASGDITPDDLLAVQDSDGTPAIFATILHVMSSTGGSSPLAYAAEQGFAAQIAGWSANAADIGETGLDRVFAPAAVSDRILVVASEQRFLTALDDAEVRAYVAAPRVYLTTRAVDANDPTVGTVMSDLLIDGIRTLPRAGATQDAAARHQLWYGALQGALETEYALVNASSAEPEGRILAGVSLEMGQPLSVLSATDTTLPRAADETLAEALAAGGLAVVPGAVADAGSWWLISADGSARSILAPRLGGNGIWSKLPNPFRRVVPVVPSEPGNNGKGGGNEYINNLKVEKEVTPTVEAGGQMARDAFEDGAVAVSRAAAKKLIGG